MCLAACSGSSVAGCCRRTLDGREDLWLARGIVGRGVRHGHAVVQPSIVVEVTSRRVHPRAVVRTLRRGCKGRRQGSTSQISMGQGGGHRRWRNIESECLRLFVPDPSHLPLGAIVAAITRLAYTLIFSVTRALKRAKFRARCDRSCGWVGPGERVTSASAGR